MTTKLPAGVRAVIIVVVLLGTLVGLAVAAIPRYVESRLAAALRTGLHARRAEVAVRAAPQEALAGRFDGLDLTVEEFAAGRLPVQRLHAELRGVEIDEGRLSASGELVLRRLAEGTATVTITERGLQDYLTTEGALRNAQVRLAGGTATVRGTIRVLTVDIPAAMRGVFVVVDGRRVSFRVESISVGDLSLPAGVSQSISSAMDPLVTTDDFPLPMSFTDITTDHGELVLRAAASR